MGMPAAPCVGRGWKSLACLLWSAARQGAFFYALMENRREVVCLVYC